MDITKNFKVFLDGEIVSLVPIFSNATIGEIKAYFKKFLSSKGKNPSDYSIQFYLTKDNNFEIGDTDKYDSSDLSSVWNQIDDGYIVLLFIYFKRMYTDVVYNIALNLDLASLTNFCQTDKRFSNLCTDEPANNFWMIKFIHDFGIIEKPVDLTWKQLYQKVVTTEPNNLFSEGVKNNQLSLIKAALTRGADIHYSNDYALRWASENGHLEAVKYLVEQGADIHAQDEDALIIASLNGYLEVVKYLVEQGADIHSDGDDSLIMASSYGHLEVVKYLVEQGADIHVGDDFPLREASSLEVVKYLESLP